MHTRKRADQAREEQPMQTCCFVISRSAVRVREVALNRGTCAAPTALYARRVTDQLGALPASAIAPRHAFALQRSLSETPVLANRVLSFLSQVLDLATRRGRGGLMLKVRSRVGGAP